jgi:hypothetical protein
MKGTENFVRWERIKTLPQELAFAEDRLMVWLEVHV